MKQSMRARRLLKNNKRLKLQSKLNLVSLMDIFTILVFFLLLNSSDVEVLQTDKSIKLPESVSEKIPATTLVVRVNSDSVIVGNQTVAPVAEILQSDEPLIAALRKELSYQASKAKELSEDQKLAGRAVTILGDHAIPYQLLKKIMATCAASDYRNISLAVSKVPSKDELVSSDGSGVES